MWDMIKAHFTDPVFVAAMFITTALTIVVTAMMRHWFGGATSGR